MFWQYSLHLQVLAISFFLALTPVSCIFIIISVLSFHLSVSPLVKEIHLFLLSFLPQLLSFVNNFGFSELLYFEVICWTIYCSSWTDIYTSLVQAPAPAGKIYCQDQFQLHPQMDLFIA